MTIRSAQAKEINKNFDELELRETFQVY